jgi:hypothetical protein
LQGHTQSLLRTTSGVDIGRVNEVDTQIQRAGDNLIDPGLIYFAAELIRTQADGRDAQT